MSSEEPPATREKSGKKYFIIAIAVVIAVVGLKLWSPWSPSEPPAEEGVEAIEEGAIPPILLTPAQLDSARDARMVGLEAKVDGIATAVKEVAKNQSTTTAAMGQVVDILGEVKENAAKARSNAAAAIVEARKATAAATDARNEANVAANAATRGADNAQTAATLAKENGEKLAEIQTTLIAMSGGLEVATRTSTATIEAAKVLQSDTRKPFLRKPRPTTAALAAMAFLDAATTPVAVEPDTTAAPADSSAL